MARRRPLAHHKQDRTTLEAELAALEELSHADLKLRWQELYGSPCPAHMKRAFLLLAVAYRVQEQALGGLDRATRRRLERVAENLAVGHTPALPPAPKANPGTRLLREWKGVVHEVIVLGTGVQYRGETWPSLSAVAREITGTRWSGPRFFGLREAPNGRR